MPTINLLPWREELRQKRKKEFLTAVLGAVLLAGGITFGTKMFYQAKISGQETRNNMLRAEITELDRQIAEINELDQRKRRLIDRMEIIDQLERTTPEAVMLVDGLVDILPDGTWLTSIQQDGTRVDLNGRAQSSQRVADLLRNVESEESAWLREPNLGPVVEATGQQRLRQFAVSVTQVRISDTEEGIQ